MSSKCLVVFALIDEYKPITLPYILFMLIEMKFIHRHSCVMFTIKSMSICNN